MKPFAGPNPNLGTLKLFMFDTLSGALVALSVADLLGAHRPVSWWPLLANAALLCMFFVTILAAGGFYRASVWSFPRRLALRALPVAAILVVGVSLLGSTSVSGGERLGIKIWIIPIIFILVAVLFRLGVAIAVRGAGARERAPLLSRLETAGPGGVPLDGSALGMSGHGSAPMRLLNTGFPAGGGRAALEDPSVVPWSGAGAAPGRIDLDTLPPDWLDHAAIAREGPGAPLLRRLVDIVGSLVLIVALLPLLLLTALAIRLESRGPVFYRQERVGKDGLVFTLLKFRSMTFDAERDGPCWAQHRDPRVTRIGRLIRRTRIDELPQVINVLRGEMALIGPRPERPLFVEQLAAVIPHYRSRDAVRPGITGWAQVNYPYGASVEDARNKLAYDLYYIRHRTLAMDVAIVVRTIRVVLLQEGAR